MLNELAKIVHENAKSKGFYENEKNIGEMLCLIHSEVSEGLEADRKKRFANLKGFEVEQSYQPHGDKLNFEQSFQIHIKDTFEDEMADILIRVLDLCAYKKIDIEKHLELKIKYNSTREHKHGKSY